MNCYGSLYTNLLYRIIFLAGGSSPNRMEASLQPDASTEEFRAREEQPPGWETSRSIVTVCLYSG